MRTAASANDPWGSPVAGATAADVDDFDLLTANRAKSTASPSNGGRANGAGSPFDMSAMDGALSSVNGGGGAKPKKTPESFLGPNSNLVNLENLVRTGSDLQNVFSP